MNIIEKITQAIFEDDEDPNKQSEYLIETYLNSANQIEIDAIFVCLCGYSSKTLIGNCSA
ncbi:TPA: hypothetical protein I8Y83_002769 [Legionella pneumophila]|uniref:Uncharacterized protein n=1 Tax=Legionella bozemanae TaxID=447 RepID=A0A0W0REN7_LEGBO|nr:hypothetical protein [Legionella bozemanae]KTC69556.1 hypothetical protein Lboz_3072 [Legionella bozemanae]STP13833.1 Uncharacterised protein [Legionella bozemanae]HAT1722214.1 hypothetical protein [Legionella pneumophila]